MTTLFDPIKVGALELPNRIIMAPLTRSRAVGAGRVPNALMAEYYAQRASAGLILSEATSVTPAGGNRGVLCRISGAALRCPLFAATVRRTNEKQEYQ